ncbi:MAG: hypothetical protein K2N44_14310, partial [Lachnospiraceae bacterium]|nr:hypothetical protein [Lachnospiraceae bacterium]
ETIFMVIAAVSSVIMYMMACEGTAFNCAQCDTGSVTKTTVMIETAVSSAIMCMATCGCAAFPMTYPACRRCGRNSCILVLILTMVSSILAVVGGYRCDEQCCS